MSVWSECEGEGEGECDNKGIVSVLGGGLCWCLYVYARVVDGRSDVQQVRSGVNLKVIAGLLDGGLPVPTQSGVANFARRTGQVSADLCEARSGRLVDQGLIVLSWARMPLCRRGRGTRVEGQDDMLGWAAGGQELELATGRTGEA